MKPYKITEKIWETSDVVSLRLVDAKTSGHPEFIAGQYITVLFSDLDISSGKAYSLSSAPSESYLQITVKKIGAYSSRLHELKVGDEILISEPYGFLNPEFDAPIVAIAGGVGIAPIMSIILNTLEHNPSCPIELWFSNQTRDDIVFKETLDNLMSHHKEFRVKYFVTREKKLPTNYIPGRIDVAKILSECKYDPKTFFFVCGREDFVGSMWRDLTANGISDHRTATETFF